MKKFALIFIVIFSVMSIKAQIDVHEKAPPKLTNEERVNSKILDLSGEWDYNVEVPGMAINGELSITKSGDNYDIEINIDHPESNPTKIEDVESKENILDFYYDQTVQGMPMKLRMTIAFTERDMEGTLDVGTFGKFPLKGSRKKIDKPK